MDTDSNNETSEQNSNRMGRRSALKLGAIGFTGIAPLTAFSAGVARGAPSTTPVGVHIAFGDDPSTSLNVGWTGAEGLDASVEYGRNDQLNQSTSVEITPIPTDNESQPVAYAASLTGLEPRTTYQYRAVMGSESSETFEATTAPAAGESGFTTTVFGDHGIADPNNPGQRANDVVPEKVIETTQGLDPDLHICAGDIAYANGKPSTWELYFSEFEDFFSSTSFMTVPGNHEAEPVTGLQQYDARLNQLMPGATGTPPNENRWYSFQYGNAVFVGLNTTSEDCGPASRTDEGIPIYDTRCEIDGQDPFGNDDSAESISDTQNALYETQKSFLRERLRAAEANDSIKWKVVYFHGPLWTDAPDHAPRRELREKWGPILDGEVDGLSEAVDLVISGDNHVYERSQTLTNVEELDDGDTDDSDADAVTPTGTTYIVNGTGGTSHYSLDAGTPEWTAYRSDEFFGPLELKFGRGKIQARYVDHQAGDTVDEFSITKTAKDGSAGSKQPTQGD